MKKFAMLLCTLASVGTLLGCGNKDARVSIEKPSESKIKYHFIESFNYDSETHVSTYESLPNEKVVEKDNKYTADYSNLEKVLFAVEFSAGFGEYLSETKCTLGNAVMTESKYVSGSIQFYVYQAELPNKLTDMVFTFKISQQAD